MTADKIWVHHYEHETKRQSITKVHLQKRKFKTHGKEKSRLQFLGCRWFIHKDCLEDGTTINQNGSLQHSKL